MFEALLYFPMTEDERADGTSIPGTGACKLLKKFDSIHKVLDWLNTVRAQNTKYMDTGEGFCYTFRLSGFKFLELKTHQYQTEYSSRSGTKLDELSSMVFDVNEFISRNEDDVDEYLFKCVKKHIIQKYVKFVGKPNQLGEELGYGTRVVIKSMGEDFALVHMVPDGTGQIDFHFQKLDTCQHEWVESMGWASYPAPMETKPSVRTGKYTCRNCGEERVHLQDTPF